MITFNPEARALMKQAADKCPSCALPESWPLRIGTFRHRSGVTCKAPEQRQALRALASRGKDDAILKRTKKDRKL